MIDDFRPQKPAKPAPTLKPTSDQYLQTQTIEQATPFQTPDQVRAQDEQRAAFAAPVHERSFEPGFTAPAVKTRWCKKLNLRWPPKWPPTKQEVVAYVLILLLFGGVGAGAFIALSGSEAEPVTKQAAVTQEPPKPTTVASNLSGLQVAPEANQRPVVGVMIENSQAARPQSGLSDAGVVFEAVAEGGITRFLALFQDKQPESLGPIRSARPYYVQWNESFRAAYAHVGGSPEALANIKSWGVQDLDQFANSGLYNRVSSKAAPHNVYANVGNLTNAAIQKGYKSDFVPLTRKAESPAAAPNASRIDFSLSSALYNAHYDYDPTSNKYNRSEGGAVHSDANTGQQLAPNVVIGLVVPMGQGGRTAQGGSYSNYNPLGTGQAYIFQDGAVTIGTWTKNSNTEQLTFTDSAGKPVALNPGQAWITAVTAASKITYQ